MDPLSITLAVGTICKALWDVSKFLNDFRHGSDTASRASKDLADEVNTWYNTLHAVEVGLKSQHIQNAEKMAERGEAKAEKDELWRAVAESVDACTTTIDRLQKGMKNFSPDQQTSLPQHIWQRVKLNLKENEMIGLKSRVRTHTNALQLVLQIINVRAAYLAPNSVVSELGPMIQALSKTMVSLQDSVAKQNPTGEEDDDGFSNSETLVGSQYTRDLNRSAERVLSSAKTVWSKSEASRSEANLSLKGEPMDPAKMERTLSWIPEPATEEEIVPFPAINYSPAKASSDFTGTPDGSIPKSPLSAPGTPLQAENTTKSDRGPEEVQKAIEGKDEVSDASHTLADSAQQSEGIGAVAEEETDEADSENEFELEEAKIFLDHGSDQYLEGNYDDAREILTEACQQARRLSIKQQQLIDLGERQLMLAICIYRSGDLDSAEKHLFALTRENISKSSTTEKDSKRLCLASHLLAQVYLRKEQHDAAKKLCRKALIGRYRVVGKFDPTYNESLYLLSMIEAAAGNLKVAEIHKNRIPGNLTEAVSERVQASLQGKVGRSSNSPEQAESPSSRPPKEYPPIQTHRLSDYSYQSSDYGDTRSTDTPITDTKSVIETANTPNGSVEGQSVDFEPTGPPVRAHTNSSYSAPGGDKDIGSLPPTQLEVSNLHILQEFVKFMPSKHRRTGDLVPLDQLDNSVPSNIIGWLERFSIDYDPFVTSLHVIAAVGHAEVLSTLLDRGIDPGCQMAKDHICPRRVPHYSGCTPLHFAATYGRAGITKILLDYGADINAQDWKKKTAVHYAARVGVSTLLELLLDRGAEANVKDIDGLTPLHIAASNGHTRFLTTLLDTGVDIETEDFHHNTAVHVAAASGQLEIVRILLDRGTKLEAMNVARHTPLQRAIEKGHLEVVDLLMDRGADIESRDVLGRTCLHTACNFGMPKIVERLLEVHADTSTRDAHMKTPKDLASDRLHADAESVLKKWEKEMKKKNSLKSSSRTWPFGKQRSSSTASKDTEALAKQMETLARQGTARSDAS